MGYMASCSSRHPDGAFSACTSTCHLRRQIMVSQVILVAIMACVSGICLKALCQRLPLTISDAAMQGSVLLGASTVLIFCAKTLVNLNRVKGAWRLSNDSATFVGRNGRVTTIEWMAVTRIRWTDQGVQLRSDKVSLDIPWWLFGEARDEARAYVAAKVRDRSDGTKRIGVGVNYRSGALLVAILLSLFIANAAQLSFYGRVVATLLVWVPLFAWALFICQRRQRWKRGPADVPHNK